MDKAIPVSQKWLAKKRSTTSTEAENLREEEILDYRHRIRNKQYIDFAIQKIAVELLHFISKDKG